MSTHYARVGRSMRLISCPSKITFERNPKLPGTVLEQFDSSVAAIVEDAAGPLHRIATLAADPEFLKYLRLDLQIWRSASGALPAREQAYAEHLFSVVESFLAALDAWKAGGL